jgi:ribosomal protein L9
MEVILLEDVKTLGKKGDRVNINDGYARNFVLPKKLGIEATGKNINDLKLQKANEERIAKQILEEAKALKGEIEKKEVTLTIKVGDGGKIFGSISSKEIAEAVKKQLELEVDKKKMQVANGAIKTLGVHNVIVKIHPKVAAELKIKVVEA